MFLTNNSPDLYAVTLCIMFRKNNFFYDGSQDISEFEWKCWML